MKKIFCLLCIVFLAGLIFIPVLEAGIYIKRDNRGTINLTDNPDGDDYTLLMESIKSKIPEDYEVPSAEELSEMVSSAADRHNIPEALIYAVIQVESNGDSQAKSHRGATGLMQLMPATAKELGVEDIWDPVDNINGGSRYLKQMLNRFDGNLTLTLAAYNAGPGNVEKYDGVPPFSETQKFIELVRGAFDSFKVKRDTIYTYVDERGITNVTNIK